MMYSIVGAGIGGLATAVALEQKGIPYQIFEKTPVVKKVGAGIWLAPNALKVLEHINVLDQVIHKGNTIKQITIAKSDLSPISDSNQDFVKEQFGYTTVAIHRAELQAILLEQIPKEKIHFGKAFQAFKELNNGKIKLSFEDKTEYETDFLIGADGINSKLRQQLFTNSSTRYSGQTCWRGIANIELEDDFKHRGMEIWGNQVRFGLSRISKGKVYWFAVALDQANQKDEQAVIKEKLFKLFKDFDPMIQQLIQATPQDKIMRNDINDLKPMSKWYQDNICLIGDAGHATTPNMGQGGAQALEDAYYLTNLIQKDSNNSVFAHFQEQRQKKVNMIVKQSWMMGKMAHWKYGKWFRNFILRSAPTKLFNKKMIEMYTL